MQNVTGVTTNSPAPADGDDYTWDDTDTPLTYASLVRTVYRLQDEVAALAGQVVKVKVENEDLKIALGKATEVITMNANNGRTIAQVVEKLMTQVVELRERMEKWTADS